MGDDKRGGVRPRSYRGTCPRFASGTLMSLSDDTAPLQNPNPGQAPTQRD